MSARTAPPMGIVIALATLMPLGMHLMVPAFPIIARDLTASDHAVQLSLTVYVAGIALAQLVYGPLSDRFGRLPPLRVGLAAQIVGSLIAAAAPDVGVLLAGRAIQGVGACAGLVLGRAMLRDTYSAEKSAPLFAYIATALGTAAAVSPILGAVLTSWIDWRASLVLTAVAGLGMIMLTFLLRETHGGKAELTGPAGMLRDLVHLLRLRQFSGSMIGFAFPGVAFFAFLAVAPGLSHDRLHMSPQAYGLYYSAIPVGYMMGSFAAGRILPRLGAVRVARWALGGNLFIAFAGLAGILIQGITPFWLFVPMAALNIVGAFAIPALMARAIGADPKLIGSAAGLLGFCQMSLAGVGTQLIGALGGQAEAVAAIGAFCMTVSLVGGLWGLRDAR
jgi:DHA1 family bicyclomycin/chloramphenicol resistance-like MFS transporter